MSDAVLISLIAAIGSILCVILTGVISYMVAKMREENSKLKVEINSRMDQLLEAARAAGNVEGRQELTDENLKNKQ